MTIAVLKEPADENRVALLPEHVMALSKLSVSVRVETSAGDRAFASDRDYETAGAQLFSRSEICRDADIVVCIQPPVDLDLEMLRNKILLGLFFPLMNRDFLQTAVEKNVTLFSLDMLPRTTRAQSMDVLSSQANIAGYKAVLLAASHYPRYFPMFMTAAGSIPPVKLLILGAGVAGLQAIATAKRLGAVVEVFDTRPAVKEEVMSLGGKFVEVEGAADAAKAGGYAVEQSEDFMARQKAKIAERVEKSDVIITTAQIPGKRAPILITEEMLQSMRRGSLIVDLAASTGGNTARTENNKTVVANGVSVVGNSNLASDMPGDASKLFGKNILNFLQLIVNKDGGVNLNFNDDLVKGTCVAHAGNITNERLQAAFGATSTQ